MGRRRQPRRWESSLCGALEALGAHRDAIVLVGAQAVYLHVGAADLAVRPYTTDGDLVLDPARLGEIPPLERALTEAGFLPKRSDTVGVWITKRPESSGSQAEVCVDLLVPAGVSPGKGRRAARLTGHDALAARKVLGLEGALVDVELRKIGALSEDDGRVFDVQVAGPAALLVAKLIKIDDRIGTERYSDKDALDVIRLLRGTDTNQLADRMNRLLGDARCVEVTTRALAVLERDFAKRDRPGVEMAIRSAGDLIDADELAMSCEILSGDLLAVLGRRD